LVAHADVPSETEQRRAPNYHEKENIMATCKICKTTSNIVHSGTDALLLGIPGAQTGTMCYSCAQKANTK
jgi:hypothetical protein